MYKLVLERFRDLCNAPIITITTGIAKKVAQYLEAGCMNTCLNPIDEPLSFGKCNLRIRGLVH